MTSSKPQFLAVDGANGPRRRVAYLETGMASGKPCLVWLSGLRSEMTSTKATALADWAGDNGFPLLRFDYSGHGQSEGAFEDGTIGDWLEETLAILEQVAARPKLLIGSSMGAWIALLALRRLQMRSGPGAGRPCGAVLIAPAWDMTEELMWKRFPAEARAALERDGVFMRPSRYGDGPYPITRRLIEEGRRHLIKPAPFDPGCPIRILHGQQDPDVPWRHSLDLVALLESDDVQLTLIKDGEHRLSRPQDIALLLRAVRTLTEAQPGWSASAASTAASPSR